MRRMMAAAVALVFVTTGCSSGGTGNSAPAAATTAATQAADANLVLSMYSNINDTFQLNPDDGVRAIIASQYPGDSADVDFKRCVNAILPGAKTLPRSKRIHFTPNILTMSPDPKYTVTSDRVKGVHPQGRIYVTDVTITDGSKPRVHQRHQVILDGKAYQFSTC
jgi:hypothetical protein